MAFSPGKGKLEAVDWHCREFPGWRVFICEPVRDYIKLRSMKLGEVRKAIESPDSKYVGPEPDEIRFACRVRHEYYVHVVVLVVAAEKKLIIRGTWPLPTGDRLRGKDQP